MVHKMHEIKIRNQMRYDNEADIIYGFSESVARSLHVDHALLAGGPHGEI